MQTINRNNYEEFFLLYVDDELNTSLKLAVENFVEQNPDLAVEFNMLLQTRSVADKTIFFDKENLIRTEGNCINETNYEEYFLLYIDNELSAAKRGEVEMYVLQHPKLQDEFTTLKQAVLSAEVINYGDKKDLYRTEKRRAFYLKPWRLAAAAVFTGVCAIGFWLMQKPAATIIVANNHVVQPAVKSNIVVPKATDSIQQITKQQSTEMVAQQQQSSPIKKEKKNIAEVTVAKNKKQNALENNNNVITENNQQQQLPIVIEHKLIQHNEITKDKKEPPTETHDIAVVPDRINQQQNNNTASLQTQQINQQQNNHYNVYPVAYKEINTNDDDNSLRVGMLDLNKTKVKSFLKKAGRLFGNKSNDLANEDGKLQVANFEIDTKKQ